MIMIMITLIMIPLRSAARRPAPTGWGRRDHEDRR